MMKRISISLRYYKSKAKVEKNYSQNELEKFYIGSEGRKVIKVFMKFIIHSFQSMWRLPTPSPP